MESILQDGRLYYQGLSDEAKDIVNKFFRDMDRKDNGTARVQDVIDFLIKKGLSFSDAHKAFEYTGLSEDHNLTMEDAVAVWYTLIIRPCCKQCKTIIVGTYYSCVTCYNMSITGLDTDTWDLCADCYNGREFCHEHGLFFDNFALLHMENQLENIPENQSLMDGSSSNLNAPQDNIQAVRRELNKILKKTLAEETFSAEIATPCNIM